MQANKAFQRLDKRFWANVRSISEALGYTDKKTKQIRIYSDADMIKTMHKIGLTSDHLFTDGKLTELGGMLQAYFIYRAEVLNNFAEPRLMDAEQASQVFLEHRARLNPNAPIPMNKQKGEKKAPAYLTGLVNMLIEAHINDLPCDYNPKRLTTITRANAPLRTLARRVDGCFPDSTNPIAIWEIKEYYYTTTFGSRVADGVYETLLDGLELEELREHEGIDIQHLLIIDSHYTWWECGKSYLCRIIDMLNMGYVDEVLFGYEVVERLPQIVQGWVSGFYSRGE
jgi:hypothetical protein